MIVFNNSEVAFKWSSSAAAYQGMDSCMQTGFYTLVNMLKLNEAKNILEVACGTGRLLPYALSLKQQSCHYYATDISK
jgi:ubiquinone/menaquinone biosynthesis C-methylase UbiE